MLNNYSTHLKPQSKIFQFQFNAPLIENNKEKELLVVPKKILLSSDKRLLLLHGAYLNQTRSLLVYQLVEDSSPKGVSLHLIFHDYCFTYADVCFSVDCSSLVCVPSRFSSYIFLFQLPLIECSYTENPLGRGSELNSHLESNSKPIDSQEMLRHHFNQTNRVLFGPRKVIPFAVLGPALDGQGKTVEMTNIVSNFFQEGDAFHYVTWNNEGGTGEYCCWTVSFRPKESDVEFNFLEAFIPPESQYSRVLYKMCPKYLGDVSDFEWLNVKFSHLLQSPKLIF